MTVAKYDTYSLMDFATDLILDYSLVQVTQWKKGFLLHRLVVDFSK